MSITDDTDVMVDIRSVHKSFGPLGVLKGHRPHRMDDGRIVEQGPPGDVVDRPRHERTRAFLSKVPS
ncbi:hypothetical protein GCM10010330_47310 [Streptomyces tendae]|nr:hypothetical protein GCM10010330_47310 [Streptomyces tendae]